MKVIVLLISLTLTLPLPAQSDTSWQEALQLIDVWLAAQHSYDNLPGISVAVVKDQEVIWSRGYGYADLDRQVRATPETKYSICSISKLFTSVAIMRLYEEGKLRLDDEIHTHLPWFDLKQQYPESGPITIRSLLTHSSGLPRESAHPYWTGPDFPFPSRDEVKSGLEGQQTLYPASTYFQYSNLGMTLLGEVVAEVSGMPYDDFIHTHILQPLAMQHTVTYMPAGEWGASLATGYGAAKRNGARDPVALFDARGIAAAAGFSSTVEDLARFARWQFQLLADGGEEILKASTLKYMQQVHWMDPDWKTSWGLGFSVWEENGTTIVGHGGSCPGYRSTIAIHPQKKLAVIVMINASAVNPSKYAGAIAAVLAKAEGKSASPDSLQLIDYAGYYQSQPWWPEEVLLPWQGQLASLGLPNDNPANAMTLLKPTGKDLFRRVRHGDQLGEEIRFDRDEQGRVIRFWQHQNPSRRLGGL